MRWVYYVRVVCTKLDIHVFFFFFFIIIEYYKKKV